MPKIPGCPTTSSHILQYASQHALLDILTHIPLHSRTYVTYIVECEDIRGLNLASQGGESEAVAAGRGGEEAEQESRLQRPFCYY